MAVANAILRQEIVSIRVRFLIMFGRVPWVPIEQEVGTSNSSKNFGSFGRSRGIASRLIFENQNHILLGCFFSRVLQLFIHGRPIGRLVIEPPEIETANAIGLERLCQLNAALKYFVLLLKREVGVELAKAFQTERVRCFDFWRLDDQ